MLKQEYITLVAHVVGYILCDSKYGLGGLDIHEQNIFIKSIIHYWHGYSIWKHHHQ